MGVIGLEPIQSETPDLQSGPALLLRRTPGILYQFTSDCVRASRGTRTPDQLITNQLLYQLSYTGLKYDSDNMWGFPFYVLLVHPDGRTVNHLIKQEVAKVTFTYQITYLQIQVRRPIFCLICV